MKILVIDDSALMRRALKEILEEIPGAEIRSARNGRDGLEEVEAWKPDVVTLDVNMPVMDGLTCLSHIMTEHPRPVVMVSSITTKDSVPSLEALSMGAVDVIEKPDGTVSRRLGEIGDIIRRKVKVASRAQVAKGRPKPPPVVRRRAPTPAKTRPASRSGASAERLIVIGVSTGGPTALEHVIPGLPEDLDCPVIIAQHMPGNFTSSFASRLDGMCPVPVVEVTKMTKLESGRVHLIHGSNDGVVGQSLGRLVLDIVPTDRKWTWHPSVGRLMESVLNYVAPAKTLGVMLTGMGDDGAKEMHALFKQGGHTIAEAESSAVVYGMPKELVDLGGAREVVDITDVAPRIRSWARRRK